MTFELRHRVVVGGSLDCVELGKRKHASWVFVHVLQRGPEGYCSLWIFWTAI